MKVVKSVELDEDGKLKVEKCECETSLPMQWPRAFATAVNYLCWTAILIAFFYFGGCKLLQ